MTDRKRKKALGAILVIVFLFGVGMTVRQQLVYQSILSSSAEAVQVADLPKRHDGPAPAVSKAVEPSALPETAEEPEPPEPLPEEAAALANIDLDALQAVNGDVIGWIEIPGTELSYPLMQGTDNQFYLSHNWKGEASSGGSVFLESTNSSDLTDFHTIIYAHRMRNDTMFGVLKYYKNLNFLQEHPSVYLVADDGVYRYDIFSAHEVSVKGIVYRLDLTESGLEGEFLQYCVEDSVIEAGIFPETEDRILTLSTCTGNGHATRWVVQGVLAQTYQLPQGEALAIDGNPEDELALACAETWRLIVLSATVGGLLSR